MPYLIVSSMEYGDIFPKLLLKRLGAGGEGSLPAGDRCIIKKSDRAAKAISETLLYDLKPLEMARILNFLPVSLRDKKEILPRAVKLVPDEKHADYVLNAVKEYMSNENVLIAEGFLRFRLPLLLDEWAIAVDRAGEEHILSEEYCALIDYLSPEESDGEANMVLYGDGKIVLSLDNGSRIESTGEEENGILSLLSALDPKSIFVYDLSGGKSGKLLTGIRMLFGERACFFVKRD